MPSQLRKVRFGIPLITTGNKFSQRTRILLLKSTSSFLPQQQPLGSSPLGLAAAAACLTQGNRSPLLPARGTGRSVPLPFQVRATMKRPCMGLHGSTASVLLPLQAPPIGSGHAWGYMGTLGAHKHLTSTPPA